MIAKTKTRRKLAGEASESELVARVPPIIPRAYRDPMGKKLEAVEGISGGFGGRWMTGKFEASGSWHRLKSPRLPIRVCWIAAQADLDAYAAACRLADWKKRNGEASPPSSRTKSKRDRRKARREATRLVDPGPIHVGDAARHNAAIAAGDLAPQPPAVVDVEASAPMTKAEQKELGMLERQIEANLQGFVEVGQCLARIRDGRLYRQSHGTFDAYCADRWDFRRAHAYRLIDAAAVVERLSPNGDAAAVVPDRESYARPLARVDPDQQKEVWQQIVAAAPRVADKPKISAKLVEKAVQQWLTPGDEADARQEAQTQRREAAKEANGLRDRNRFAELLAQFRDAAGKVVDEFPDKKHRVRLAESLRDLAACVENGEPF